MPRRPAGVSREDWRTPARNRRCTRPPDRRPSGMTETPRRRQSSSVPDEPMRFQRPDGPATASRAAWHRVCCVGHPMSKRCRDRADRLMSARRSAWTIAGFASVVVAGSVSMQGCVCRQRLPRLRRPRPTPRAPPRSLPSSCRAHRSQVNGRSARRTRRRASCCCDRPATRRVCSEGPGATTRPASGCRTAAAPSSAPAPSGNRRRRSPSPYRTFPTSASCSSTATRARSTSGCSATGGI